MNVPSVPSLELTRLVGRGSCGAVYQAIDPSSGRAFAVKCFNLASVNQKWLKIASETLMNMPPHPGILGVEGYHFQEGECHLILPWVETGECKTLEERVGKITQDEAWQYIYEICDSIAWLHKHNLVHCNLRPRNIFLVEDGASRSVVTDVLQGWLDPDIRLNLNDHAFYLSPEQFFHPEGLPDHGSQWDVYAFGVISYRLLTGAFPRGQDLYDQIQEQHGEKLWSSLSLPALQARLRSEEPVVWPNTPTSVWGKRRQEIINTCLSLDPQARWADLREVMREFERLESDYLIGAAQEKLERDQTLQKRKLQRLKVGSYVLGAGLLLGSGYAWYQQDRAERLEAKAQKELMALQQVVQHRESALDEVEKQLDRVEAERRQTAVNLQLSQQAVDQFLSQILQLPTGLGLQAEISQNQILEALDFYERDRVALLKSPQMRGALARNHFNTAQLLLRSQQRDEAVSHLKHAEEILLKLQAASSAEKNDEWAMLLGRTARWLGVIQTEAGRPSEAYRYFKEAVTTLVPIQKKDPGHRTLRYELAAAWYELARRARLDTREVESLEGFQKVRQLITQASHEGVLLEQEIFLLAKSQMQQAQVYRAQEKPEEAMKELFGALEYLVKLVENTAPRNPEQALALAAGYLDFGEMLATKLGSSDAMEAQYQANQILTELVTSQPSWVEAKLLLARNFGNMAALERDAGKGAEALRRQQQAIEITQALQASPLQQSRFLLEHAKQLRQLSQLSLDLKRPKDAMTYVLQAIQALDAVAKDQAKTWDEVDRRDGKVLLAELKGILATTLGESKQRAPQKVALLEAQEIWNALRKDYPSFQPVTQGITWVDERLKNLK